MIWIYAVTCLTHYMVQLLSFWNWSVFFFPKSLMNLNNFPVHPALGISPFVMHTFLPKPASSDWVYNVQRFFTSTFSSKKKHWKYPIMTLAAGLSLLAQPNQQVTVQPDCQIPFVFTVANQIAPANFQGSGIAALNNKQIGCNVWQVQYASTGFGAVSLVLQSANDIAGVPGAFGTIGGTVVQGINPMTSTTGSSNLITTFGTAFAPWVRMTPTTATGSGQITGIALGWRQISNAGTAAPGSTNATIVAPLGQTSSAASVSVVPPNDLTSGCTRQPVVNTSATGNVQIVTGVAAKNIFICALELATTPAENIKLTEGTTANCAAGTADATGLFNGVSALSFEYEAFPLQITLTAGDNLCVNQSVAQALGLTIWTIIK